MGVVIVPILFAMFIIFASVGMFDNGVDVVINNGYDEETFQDYAYSQYFEQFAESEAMEDNLLIVFLTTEEHYEFYYIAMVGDHIHRDINYLMGNNETALGHAMNTGINETNYKYSLDHNLAAVIDAMTASVQDLTLESSFTCHEEHIQSPSRLVNNTDIPMTDSTVNEALDRFTQSTGIPIVILVEDAQDVFGSKSTTVGENSPIKMSSATLVVLIISVSIIAIVIIRNKKGEKKESKYRHFDDQS